MTRIPQRTLVALVAAVVSSPARAQGPTTLTFDGYVLGIKAAELTVASGRLTIRKRDNATTRWSSPHSAAEADVAGDTAFALWGSIRNLPARIKELRGAHWAPLSAVGWPDANSIYVRNRELTETVNGHPVRAFHWALRDATRPLDLTLGADDQLIVDFDPGDDFVLVRRGYEKFTTVGRWNDRKISPARYGYRALGKQMMPADDGVGLATLVYLPDGGGAAGPFPTV